MRDRRSSARDETNTPSRDAVARRAYELFQARGGGPGHALENWLDAERELSRTAPGEAHEEPRGRRRDREHRRERV